MFDAVADAEHHCRGRDQSHLVHCAHNVEPFLRRAFCRDAFSHLIVEYLCAATRKRIQPCGLQTRDDRVVIKLRDKRDVVYLRR